MHAALSSVAACGGPFNEEEFQCSFFAECVNLFFRGKFMNSWMLVRHKKTPRSTLGVH